MAKDLSYRRGFVRHFPFSGDCSCVIRENQLGEIFFADEMQSQQQLSSVLVEKTGSALSLAAPADDTEMEEDGGASQFCGTVCRSVRLSDVRYIGTYSTYSIVDTIMANGPN